METSKLGLRRHGVAVSGWGRKKVTGLLSLPVTSQLVGGQVKKRPFPFHLLSNSMLLSYARGCCSMGRHLTEKNKQRLDDLIAIASNLLAMASNLIDGK